MGRPVHMSARILSAARNTTSMSLFPILSTQYGIFCTLFFVPSSGGTCIEAGRAHYPEIMTRPCKGQKSRACRKSRGSQNFRIKAASQVTNMRIIGTMLRKFGTHINILMPNLTESRSYFPQSEKPSAGNCLADFFPFHAKFIVQIRTLTGFSLDKKNNKGNEIGQHLFFLFFHTGVHHAEQ